MRVKETAGCLDHLKEKAGLPLLKLTELPITRLFLFQFNHNQVLCP
jgi:hypothetical protein